MAQVRTLLAINQELFARLEEKGPDLEVVDAEVRWVNQRERLV